VPFKRVYGLSYNLFSISNRINRRRT